MELVVYNNDYVRRHSLFSKCQSKLDAVSKKDNPNDFFDCDIECMDVDAYERQGHYDQQKNTVDAVIGISACNNKRLSKHRLLLIELKTNCKKPNNLSKSELETKVTHTKGILGAELTINKGSLVVFDEPYIAQAIHWLTSKQREGGEICNITAWSVKDFQNNIRSIKTMLYNPINPKEKVLAELEKFVQNKQYKELFMKVYYWLHYSEKIRHNDVFEYENISNIIKTFWNEFRKGNVTLYSEEDEITAQVLDDDIKTILRKI